MRTVILGRGLLAIAGASLALMSLVYGDFAPAWKSWPGWIPGGAVWIDGFALLVLAAAAGLWVPRLALPSAVAIGVYYGVWAVIAAPPILADPLGVGAWYGVMEAMTSLAGVAILYALLRWPSSVPRAIRAAQILFGLTCIFYGWSHFAFADYTAGMVPSWLPGHLGLAYATGAGHMAAGVGIVIGLLPRLAAILEAAMMSLFGLLVWVPSFWADPRPAWATPPQNQWSELVVTLVLAASAWIVAISLTDRRPSK